MKNIKELFGKRLKEIRKSRKLTQERLAEKIGLNPRQLTRIENGENFPSADTLARISVALNVSLSYLFDIEWTEINELYATGTDVKPVMRLVKQEEVFYIKPSSTLKNQAGLIEKTVELKDSEVTMIELAKKLNKPITVEYFSNKTRCSMKTYFPNGDVKEEIGEAEAKLSKTVDEIMQKLKNISDNQEQLDFINLALSSLTDKKAFDNLKILLKGMELYKDFRK